MSARRLLSVAALIAVLSTQAVAQSVQPSRPATPAAPTTSTAKPATPAAMTPVTKKINLNTASATELDGLPQIGPARSKAIVDARAKTKFKNWDDFVARKVVPSNAEAAIKDLVSF